MNQILVTQKLYVTPELKRKKKIYKFSFIISIMLIIVLTGIYIYCEYERLKESVIANDILRDIDFQGGIDETTIAPEDNALIVAITQERIIEENISQSENLEEADKTSILNGTYTASNGQIYSINGIINIPKINVKYPIISEFTDAFLKVSICKFWGPNPNEVGNLCLVGHNYKNEKFFGKIPTLQCGDIVEITGLDGKTVQYEVYDMYTVYPSDTNCTSQLTRGKKEVTLITCTDDGKQRVVVKCTEK